MKAVERWLEGILWGSRYIVLLPVIFSMLIALALFLMATIDTIILMRNLLQYPTLEESARYTLQIDTISGVVGALDVYLIAALMLLVSLGLYELFVARIDQAENSIFAERLLLFKSFDDFKDRLASVVLIVLVVKFFQQALHLKYEAVTDLLMLAVGIALVGVALFLTKKQKGGDKGEAAKP
ncbi:MAG: YqhA family protein [Anaerolineae bacterium]|nr:YqhA family protein [Anaerolineae bacterium]